MDANCLNNWQGLETPELEILGNTENLDNFSTILNIGACSILLWDIGGPGTADLFGDDGNLILVRVWLDDESLDENDNILKISNIARFETKNNSFMGIIPVESGILCVLWVEESGIGVDATPPETDTKTWVPEESQWMSGAGRFVRVVPGKYACYTDELEGDDFNATRLHMIRQ